MLKKYKLFVLLMISALSHNLAAMQQNQNWWNRFTSWMRSPRKEYVEINTLRVPAIPTVEDEKELAKSYDLVVESVEAENKRYNNWLSWLFVPSVYPVKTLQDDLRRNQELFWEKLKDWTDKKEKIEQQEVQRRAMVKKYEKSMEKTPTTPYG